MKKNAKMRSFAPGPVQPTLTMERPLSVSTGGIHPLVKASMLPRLKSLAMRTAKVRSAGLKSQISGTNAFSVMSRSELRSRRGQIGRKPRA